MNKKLTVAIAGNPNCGKTLIFNRLTGRKQKVGNWAGVTVDKKYADIRLDTQHFTIVDLPGTYSLDNQSTEKNIDEGIACEFLLTNQVDIIVNVVDASNLERHLYLTAQLLEMGIPTILLLNMHDIAKRNGMHIDTDILSKLIGCPVIPMVAHKNRGFKTFKKMLLTTISKPKPIHYRLPRKLQQALEKNTTILSELNFRNKHWLALRLLENDSLAIEQIKRNDSSILHLVLKENQELIKQDSDLQIADARFEWSRDLYASCITVVATRKMHVTRKLDKIILNPWAGIPFFLFMMYLTFFFAINIGGAFQDFFDIGSTTIFIDGFAHVLKNWHASNWIIAILANGLGKGINTVITFIPIIGSMFLFLAILEDSGYMARAAFVVDRLMQFIGLPGKAFVPLIVGFGCNVPTVMASRTLGSQRDRVLTTMMAPFMSCGARLAIYAVFVSAFFSHGGQNVIFSLYLIGILVAILTGVLLRVTLLKGAAVANPIELPTYHLPHPINIMRSTWHRLKAFLQKAGRYIIPICLLIGALNTVSIHGELLKQNQSQESALSAIGKIITPAFKPIGLKQQNWPATVGLFSGLLAKEVVVGTLNTLYSQVGNLNQPQEDFSFVNGLKAALYSVPNNLIALQDAIKNPVLASAPIQQVNQGVYGVMEKYFDGQAGAFAYLLFILLYFPCVSTMAVMRREVGKSWANFSMLWSTGIAYGIATLFYQTARFDRHPLQSSSWIISVVLLFVVVIVYLKNKTARLN
jgi:ferrous iron transport protein B